MNILDKRREEKLEFCRQVTKFMNFNKDGLPLSGGLFINDGLLAQLKEQLSKYDKNVLKFYLKVTFTDKQIRRLLKLL